MVEHPSKYSFSSLKSMVCHEKALSTPEPPPDLSLSLPQLASSSLLLALLYLPRAAAIYGAETLLQGPAQQYNNNSLSHNSAVFILIIALMRKTVSVLIMHRKKKIHQKLKQYVPKRSYATQCSCTPQISP